MGSGISTTLKCDFFLKKSEPISKKLRCLIMRDFIPRERSIKNLKTVSKKGGLPMKKNLFFLLASILLLSIAFSGVAAAHTAGPCADSDGDGMASGQEYAQHHIIALAHDQKLGDGGHKPGFHQGFNLCHQ
jgi:hypothetical protein